MFSWQFSPLKPASRSNTSYLYTPVVYHHHTGIVLRTPVVSLTGSSHDNNRWEFHNPIIASDSWSKGRWFDSRPGRYQVKLVLFQRSMAYSEIFYGKPSYNNNNNNNNRTTFTVLTSWLRVIAWVRPVPAMNAEQRQTAADLWTKPTDLSHRPAYRRIWNHIYHRPKADTHFNIPQRVEGWIDLDGWLYTHTIYMSPIWVVIGPSVD